MDVFFTSVFGKVMFLVLAVSAIAGCSISEPHDDPSSPGRRDYIWTVDTIPHNFQLFHQCWGSDPSNVWMISSSGGLGESICHFDGSKWSADGISRPIVPTAIFGLAENDIWLAGFLSDGEFLMWHYDGAAWSGFGRYIIPGYQQIVIERFCGDSRDDIYAVGKAYVIEGSNFRHKGIIFHYDGKKWSEVSIPEINVGFHTILKDYSKNLYYIRGLREEPAYGDTNKVYEFNGKSVRQIHSAPDNVVQGTNVLQIGRRVYFEVNHVIYSYKDGEYTEILRLNKPDFRSFILFGRSLNDMFIYNIDGVSHYNGTDTEYLVRFNGPRLYIITKLLFEKDVFFITYCPANGYHYIYHGKLKPEVKQ